MSTQRDEPVATGLPAPASALPAAADPGALAEGHRCRDTAASCSRAVAARHIQWVNTPVLIEAMERHRQGLLQRSMERWLLELLELPPDSPSPEWPQGPRP